MDVLHSENYSVNMTKSILEQLSTVSVVLGQVPKCKNLHTLILGSGFDLPSRAEGSVPCMLIVLAAAVIFPLNRYNGVQFW